MTSAKRLIRAVLPRKARNWLRSPRRSLEWAWDELRYGTRKVPLVQIRPDWRLSCHPAARRFGYQSLITDPAEKAELDGFISACRSGMVLLDIGAHFGLFSLAALHYGGPAAQAVAVDPSPMATRMLRIQAHLNSNLTAGRLRIVQACVTDHAGYEPMVAVGVLAGGYFSAPSRDHSATEVTHAPAITLDALVEKLRVRPTHVKIDVEGFEAAVLRGGHRLLSQRRPPILFIELHNTMIRDRKGDPEETLDLLRNYGYSPCAVAGTPLDRDSILSDPLIRITARAF
jgi:FkbM family methyltransferase